MKGPKVIVNMQQVASGAGDSSLPKVVNYGASNTKAMGSVWLL